MITDFMLFLILRRGGMLNNKNITYKKLKDICEFKHGEWIAKSLMGTGNIPVISNGNKPVGYINKYNRNFPCVTVSRLGEAGGIVNYWNQPIWVSDCFTLYSKNINLLSNRFLYYFLEANKSLLASLSGSGTIKNIGLKDLENIQISFPILEVQKFIVSILNQFNNLTTNLQGGIPAEIKLRKEQYQYYLKQLLTFNMR